MTERLPSHVSLAWLRKAAKHQLREWRAAGRDARLADVHLALARQYGFPSWRALKAHADRLQALTPAAGVAIADDDVATFLRDVGDGRISDVRSRLAAEPRIVNAIGAHPYWGGRPQALHVSIETKRRDMFDLLLGAGADVDGRNDEYCHCSPLMLTFWSDQPDMRQVLMEQGARIGLVEAMLLEDDTLVESMLSAGAPALPDFDPNGGSVLAFARTPFAIDRLLELGVSTTLKDRWGSSPIDAISRLGPRGRQLVHHLLRRGLRADPQEHARLGDKEALAALIATDPEVARSDAVFMGAVDFGHCDLVQWLLGQGADVNARSSGGSATALHSAAWNGHLAMVKLLIAAGADVHARDKEHDGTPADWAEVSVTVSNNPKCKEVAEYLSRLERRAPT